VHISKDIDRAMGTPTRRCDMNIYTLSFSLEKKKKEVAKKFACNKYNKFMFCSVVEILKNLMKQ